MADGAFNGKTDEIHEGVMQMRSKMFTLEGSVERLSEATEHLAKAVEAQAKASDKVLLALANSIPTKIVVLICFIIVIAFVGGGILKELVDSHILIKAFAG